MSIDPGDIAAAGSRRETELQGVVAAAQRAIDGGQAAEAAAWIRQAQVLAPRHPAVLTLSGMFALRTGDFSGARQALELAVAADETNPMAWLNAAMAYRAGRDSDAEMAALEQALKLDPHFVLALLQKATLLERTGRVREAAGFFHAFLASLPASERSSPSWQEAVAHSERAVTVHAAALETFLDARLGAVRARYSRDELIRAHDCVDVLTGRKRVYVQQPTFMHFPGLPAIQFYPREQFDWLALLEQATQVIQRELLQLFADSTAGFVPYIDRPDGTPLNQWQALNRSLQWSALFLWREGAPMEENLQRCPATAALLASMPMADVDGHAPTAFFSILKPKTRIPPHTGVTNTRLIVHLPLFVPEGCGFRVGSETRAWRTGSAWVFDDTIEHEAWNDSDEPRAVLIFDIWNPYLSAAERALVNEATQAVGEFNREALPSAGVPSTR